MRARLPWFRETARLSETRPATAGEVAQRKSQPGRVQTRRPMASRRQPRAKTTRARRRAQAPSIYAALDLGTNNCRLLIAKPSRRGFLVIDAFSRIIRLGEGVLSSGRLSPKRNEPHAGRAQGLRRKNEAARGDAVAADRHRSVPHRRQ